MYIYIYCAVAKLGLLPKNYTYILSQIYVFLTLIKTVHSFLAQTIIYKVKVN